MLETLILTLTFAAQQSAEARVEILHSSINDQDSSLIKGTAGERYVRFYKLNVANNGRYALWALSSAAFNEIFVADGSLVLRDGDAAPWDNSRTIREPREFDLSDDGDLVIGVTSHGTNPVSKGCIAIFREGSWSEVYETGLALPNRPTYSSSQVGIDLAVAGDSIGFKSQYASSTEWRWATILDGQFVAIGGMDRPVGQLDGKRSRWKSDFGGRESVFDVSPDGAHHMILGQLENDSWVVAVDGIVQLQTGFPVPGAQSNQYVTEISYAGFGGDGSTWLIANGNRVIRDGQVFLRDGNLTTPGLPGGKVWSSFAFASSNQKGDWYAAGIAKLLLGSENIVVSNHRKVLLEGDPIDADSDGEFIDDQLQFVDWDDAGHSIDEQGRVWLLAEILDERNGNKHEAILRAHPQGPVLQASTVSGGASMRFNLAEAESGSAAIVGYSLTGSGPTSIDTGQGVVLLDLSSGWINLGTQIVDTQGEASWQKFVPVALIGSKIWAQGLVADSSGLVTTNAISATVQ